MSTKSPAPRRCAARRASHYEGGMRVPFIAAWAKAEPAIIRSRSDCRSPPGAIQAQQAAVYDLFPTILDAHRHRRSGRSRGGWPEARCPAHGQTRRPPRRGTFLMHYPHCAASHATTSPCYRDGDVEGDLPLLPLAGVRGLALSALQPRQTTRSSRTTWPRRIPTTSTDDAGPDRRAGADTTPSIPSQQDGTTPVKPRLP